MRTIRDVLRLLRPGARRRLVLLFLLMLVGAAFEAVGVGLIVPFLDLLSAPDAIRQNALLAELHMRLGEPEPRVLLMWTGAALLVLFTLKNAYLAGMTWYKFRFNFYEQVAVSRRMFAIYLRTPYLYHLDRNSSELLRNVTEEVRKVFSHVVLAGLSLLVEVLVTLAIVVLLFVMEPVVAPIVFGAFLIVGGAFFLAIRRKAHDLGQDQVEHAGLMIRWVTQGFGSLKETKMRGVEPYFIDRFGESNDRYARAMQYHSFVKELPRNVVETLGMGAMMLLVVALLWRGSEMTSIIPTLGLFAMAAVRMMPSATRIIASLTSIKLFLPSLHALVDDFEELRRYERDERDADQLHRPLVGDIEVRGLSFRFPGADRQTLTDVDVTIPQGTSVAFVGPSGAGKTTLADQILGLLDADHGDVLVGGTNIREALDAWQRNVGYISQPVYLMDDSIRANVALGVEPDDIDDERVWACLEAAQLADFVRRELPDGIATEIGEHGTRFSGGQRQRIGIARALYHDPAVLVLDEATSALDGETEAEITRAVNALRGERTIIVIAHRFSTIQDCDQICMLDSGRVVARGTFDDLMSENLQFRRLAGTG